MSDTAQACLSFPEIRSLLSCFDNFDRKASGTSYELAKLRLVGYLDVANVLTIAGLERANAMAGTAGEVTSETIRREVIHWCSKRLRLLGCEVEERTEERVLKILVSQPKSLGGGATEYSIPVPLWKNEAADAIDSFVVCEKLLIQKLEQKQSSR